MNQLGFGIPLEAENWTSDFGRFFAGTFGKRPIVSVSNSNVLPKKNDRAVDIVSGPYVPEMVEEIRAAHAAPKEASFKSGDEFLSWLNRKNQK